MKKAVIAGYGNMGSKYAARIYKGQIEGLSLFGILCRNPKMQDKIRREMPQVKIFPHEDSMFEAAEEFDALIITTPHREHVRMAEKAKAAGLHVLCEKPLGITALECGRVVDGRKRLEGADGDGEPLVEAMIFNWRAREIYRQVKEILCRGELGALHDVIWTANFWYRPAFYHKSAAWRSSWNGEGGGLLLNQSQHLMDVWNWLFGQPSRVFARIRYGRYSSISVDDEATLLFSYENGMEGIFFSSTGDSPGTNRLEIHGVMGKLTVEDNRVLTLYKNASSTAQVSKTAEESNPVIPYVKESKEILQEKDEYLIVLQNFADAIQGKAAPLAGLSDGLRALENVNAAYLSDWTKQWVDIPCDESQYEKCLGAHCQEEKERERASDKE